MKPETAIEIYLHGRVEALGGDYRRVAWVGRRHAPDDLVYLPGRFPFFVECKAPGEKARAGQLREHDRLRAMGFKVFVCSTKEEIDEVLK